MGIEIVAGIATQDTEVPEILARFDVCTIRKPAAEFPDNNFGYSISKDAP
jgi:hypothetical protein